MPVDVINANMTAVCSSKDVHKIKLQINYGKIKIYVRV